MIIDIILLLTETSDLTTVNQDTWAQVSEVSSTEEMVDSMQQEDCQREVDSGDMKMMEDTDMVMMRLRIWMRGWLLWLQSRGRRPLKLLRDHRAARDIRWILYSDWLKQTHTHLWLVDRRWRGRGREDNWRLRAQQRRLTSSSQPSWLSWTVASYPWKEVSQEVWVSDMWCNIDVVSSLGVILFIFNWTQQSYRLLDCFLAQWKIFGFYVAETILLL